MIANQIKQHTLNIRNLIQYVLLLQITGFFSEGLQLNISKYTK